MPEFVLNGRDDAARKLDAFALGYIEAMFFTESSDWTIDEWFSEECQDAIREGQTSGEIPGGLGFADLHPDSLAAIVADCQRFQSENSALLESAYALEPGSDELRHARESINANRAGNLFWYSRNGHGVGWTDDGNAECLSALETASRAFGDVSVFFGDHVRYGNLHWIYIDHSEFSGLPTMPPKQAWGYAAEWGSMMTAGDPGACMYGFDETCRPQSEEHRRDVIAWISDCRKRVTAAPADFDGDELFKLDSFVRHIEQAPCE